MVDVPHASLTDPDLHEPKGAAAASDGQVYIADGAGSGAWTTPNSPAFMNKHIAGLTYMNAVADPTNDITVLSGTARDTANSEDIILASSITKKLDVNWTVGDNQGGLDVGSIANTTYHVWLIKRTDTDVVDVLFSTSAASPTMPSSYTKKRRIGSFIRSGGAIQTLSVAEITGGGVEVLIAATANTPGVKASTGTLTSLVVPSGMVFEAIFNAVYGNTNNSPIAAWSPAQTDGSGVSFGYIVTSPDTPTGDSQSGTASTGLVKIRTNTSGQVVIAGNDSTSITAYTYGWNDHRRD